MAIWIWIPVGAAVLLVVVAGAVYVRRRRTNASKHEEDYLGSHLNTPLPYDKTSVSPVAVSLGAISSTFTEPSGGGYITTDSAGGNHKGSLASIAYASMAIEETDGGLLNSSQRRSTARRSQYVIPSTDFSTTASEQYSTMRSTHGVATNDALEELPANENVVDMTENGLVQGDYDRRRGALENTYWVGDVREFVSYDNNDSEEEYDMNYDDASGAYNVYNSLPIN